MASSNSHAFAQLDAMIARLESLRALPRRGAALAAPAMKAENDRQIAAGQAPDGSAWQRTQRGQRPLKKAARAVSVQARGLSIEMSVRGAEALHHNGKARGRITRRIIPTSELTQRYSDAIRQALSSEFARIMGGQ